MPSSMAQTREGALKTAAKKAGVTTAEYKRRMGDGRKWCTTCGRWHRSGAFGKDASRWDGLAAGCRSGRNAKKRRRYKKRPMPRGRAFVPARDGDAKQARGRVNHFVKVGLLPEPNSLPCHDCGHIWSPGGRRHEYDHFLGYAAEHHERVQAVCTTCHAIRDSTKKKQTHCKHGHEFTPENTIVRRKDGGRACRECRRRHDRNRGRDAAYWREYRRLRAEREGC